MACAGVCFLWVTGNFNSLEVAIEGAAKEDPWFATGGCEAGAGKGNARVENGVAK